jgi:hypothetical protein
MSGAPSRPSLQAAERRRVRGGRDCGEGNPIDVHAELSARHELQQFLEHLREHLPGRHRGSAAAHERSPCEWWWPLPPQPAVAGRASSRRSAASTSVRSWLRALMKSIQP